MASIYSSTVSTNKALNDLFVVIENVLERSGDSENGIRDDFKTFCCEALIVINIHYFNYLSASVPLCRLFAVGLSFKIHLVWRNRSIRISPFPSRYSSN